MQKNLTQYRASLSLDSSLGSIIKFQMNRPVNETRFEKARTATMEYNKENSRKKMSK